MRRKLYSLCSPASLGTTGNFCLLHAATIYIDTMKCSLRFRIEIRCRNESHTLTHTHVHTTCTHAHTHPQPPCTHKHKVRPRASYTQKHLDSNSDHVLGNDTLVCDSVSYTQHFYSRPKLF